MAEYILGRIKFVYQGNWTTSTPYVVDDVVTVGGKTYICVQKHTSSATFVTDSSSKWEIVADGLGWRGDWTQTTLYNEGDLVKYGAIVYQCNTAHTSAVTNLGLENDSAKWDQFSAGTRWLGDWDTSTFYHVGDLVKYGGQVYYCSVGHISAATTALGLEPDSANWQTFNAGLTYLGNWTPATRYKVNDLVKNGGDTYICVQHHTSSSDIDETGTYFQPFVEGLQFESSWSSSADYQIGDLVTYGGYTYVAISNNTDSVPSQNTADWDPFTTGFFYAGDWNNTTYYKINSVVRLNGYTYLSTIDSPAYSATATATQAGVTLTITDTSADTDEITVVSTSGLTVGARVKLESDISSLSSYQEYFVVGTVTATTFQVSATQGGDPITLTTTTGQSVGVTSDAYVVLNSTADLEAGQAITFASSFGGIIGGATYYVLSNFTATQVRLGLVANGNAVSLSTTTSQSVSCSIAAQPGNTNYWARLNPGLYWRNSTATFTGLEAVNVTVSDNGATGATYTVVRNNAGYTITRTDDGSDYTTGDIIKILGTSLGGITPANDIKITVTASAGAITSETYQGSSVTWSTTTNYVLGDVVTYGANSYNCIFPHTSNAENRPDNDITATYWNILSTGAEEYALQEVGDTLYYGPAGPTRLPIGLPGQVLRSTNGYPTWTTYGQINNIVYVGPNGVDSPAPAYGQTIDLPWKTIRYAAKQVEDGYLRPNAQYLLKTNKQFIMKEITNYIVYTFSVTVTATNSNNNITSNKTSNLTVGMPIKFTGTVFGGLVADTTYYVKEIVDSTTFTISETLNGSVLTPTTDTGSMTATLSYDSAICERDVGIIVDALTYDIGHGGNLKSTKAALSYYTTAGNAFITSNLGSQIVQTVAGYAQLSDLVTTVLSNVAPTYNYQSLNGAATVAYQNIDTDYTAESDAIALTSSLVSIIINGLNAGVSSAIPAAINPATTIYVKTGTYTEVLPIVLNEYVTIVGDELRGTTVQPKPANPLLVNDKPKSAAVLTHLSSLLPTLVVNDPITPTSGNTVAQVTSKPDGDVGLATASAEVFGLTTKLYNIFNNGLGSVPGSLTYGTFTNYNTSLTDTAYACTGNTTGSTTGYGDGAAQLLQNKQFLQDEISDWLAANQAGTWSALSPAQQAACQRDVGYIVDAIYYDMLYGGNTQTVVAADSYFSYYQLVIQSTEKEATIAAYARLKDIIDNIATKSTSWSKTTASSQVTTGTAGSTNSGTFAQERVQDIIDYITNGLAPDVVEIATSAASATRQSAFSAIQERKVEIQKDATAWVKKYFQFLNFNEATCYRDVGYIVDAVSRDLVAQSDFATVKVGMSYYRAIPSLATVIGSQKSAELGMINFLTYKIKAIAAVGAGTLAQVLMQDAIDTITDEQNLGGLDVQTFGTTLYNNALGIVNGAEVIRANKEFLASEASAYVKSYYTGTVTSTTGSTDLFTCTADHHLTVNDPVVFAGTAITGSGVDIGTTYYVASTPASNTFTLKDSTGTTIDVSSNGTGSMTVTYAFDETSCKRDTREFVDALVYDMQYTGNYKLRRAAELYLNAVEGSNRANMYLVRNSTGLRNQTMTGLAGEIGLPVTGVTANGTTVTLTFRGMGDRSTPYWPGQTITVSGMTPSGYNGTFVVTASSKTSVTFENTTTGSMTVAGVISNQYGTKRPTAGAYTSLDSGFGPWDSNTWITTRSPYAQNCTLFGSGNVGMKIDSSLHAGGNKSIVANDYTTLCSDGIGVWCTGSNSLVELVSVFCYYSYSGYLAELGGKMRATNGNSSYGTYGVLSEGVDTYETPIYASLNNQNAEAQIDETLTDGVNEVLRIGFTNAGTNYTNASYTINGSGYNATALGDEFRDSACFESRILDNNDGSGSGQIGGAGYLTINNVASGGTSTTITLAGSDTALSTTYIGMQIQITSGIGVGQLGTIVNFNTGTKMAKIAKSSFETLTVTGSDASAETLTVASTATLYANMPIWLSTSIGGASAYTLYYVKTIVNGTTFTISTASGGATFNIASTTSGQSVSLYAAGWDHIIMGREIQSTLDSTSAYTIEPKITYTNPGFTGTSRVLSAPATWKAMTFGGGRYLAVANGSTNSSYSTDGKTWAVAGALTGTTTQWQGVEFGGGYGAEATLTVGGLGGAAALLTATITNGQVSSINVVRGGYGYTTPPVIEISGGGGVGATATAHVLNGAVSFVEVTIPGSGYTSAPTVDAKTDITTGFVVSTWGRGYTSVPTVTVSAPFSGTAFATSTLYNSLNAIVYYTNAGVTNWYRVTATGTSASTGGPTHTSGSDTSGSVTFLYIGTTANGTAVISNQGVSNITMTTAGVGYTTTPTVTIVDDNAKYVAISGTSNVTAYQTPSGAVAASAWAAGGNLPNTTWGGIAFGIITGTPIWLAVGGTSSGATTNDGATWTTVTAPLLSGGSYSSVAFGNGKFVAIQYGGTGTSVFDGNTWTVGGALPVSANWTSITYGNGRFVAIATGSTDVAYSIDNGTTWVAANVGLPSAASWTRVRYGQGLFFAISSGGTVAATSADGIVWVSKVMPASSNWSDIVLGNNNGTPLWAAISNTSGTVAASIKTGAPTKARTKVTSGSISAIFLVEPGSGYPRGTVSATTASTNVITVDNTENLIDSQPIEFTGLDSYGLVTNTTYYVIGSTIVTNTSFKVSATAGSSTPVNLETATSLSNLYRAGPIATITDSNKTKSAVVRMRMGDGVLGNPSFSNRGTNNSSASTSVTGDGYSDLYQPSTFINVFGLSSQPTAGANVEFASIPNTYFKLVQVLNVLPDTGSRAGLYSATFQINPGLSTLNAPAHNDLITTRLKYSQVRLTGHDFLYIGTGNASETNYPYVDVSTAVLSNQTNATNGGRNFFTSTDQDGNFNVGNLFSVQQATGTATLNATAFNLSGLQSLQLGSVSVGTGSATITQFSADPYFTANSDNILPTQRAIKSYITSQIGGGQSSLNVNTLTSGLIYVANNTITTTTGVGINVKAKMNFTGGIDGAPVALQFFLLR